MTLSTSAYISLTRAVSLDSLKTFLLPQVTQLAGYFEPLIKASVGVASKLKDHQQQMTFLDQTKTLAESALQMLYAAKEGGGNPKARPFYALCTLFKVLLRFLYTYWKMISIIKFSSASTSIINCIYCTLMIHNDVSKGWSKGCHHLGLFNSSQTTGAKEYHTCVTRERRACVPPQLKWRLSALIKRVLQNFFINHFGITDIWWKKQNK